MTRCSNKEIGVRLHAYELGLLDVQGTLEIELHILECAHCRQLASMFVSESHLLRSDRLVQELSSRAVRSRHRTVITWLAVAAVAVLASAVSYNLWVQPKLSKSGHQEIYLTSVRSAEGRTIYLDSTASVSFKFQTPDSHAGMIYILTIRSLAGDTLVVDSSFDAFDDRGVGTLTLPTESFEPGFYRLIVGAPDGSELSFNFKAE